MLTVKDKQASLWRYLLCRAQEGHIFLVFPTLRMLYLDLLARKISATFKKSRWTTYICEGVCDIIIVITWQYYLCYKAYRKHVQELAIGVHKELFYSIVF